MRSSDILDNETGAFIALSRRAGERFDLIQAGGGNTSVKLADGTMLIKSSGVHLSDLSPGHGYTRVDLGAVLRVLDDPSLAAVPDKRQRDAEAAKRLLACVRDSGSRPSIETFLHALLDRYTLHTHPLAVNAVACRSDWKDVLAAAAGADAAFVPYGTPGFELALLLKTAVDDHVRLKGRKPRTLFLQNHGLITSADDGGAAMAATESVLTALEQVIGADLSPYKLVIHCGACMWNRRTMLSRILRCQQAGVPVTNYGLTIAYSLGICDRALEPFNLGEFDSRSSQRLPAIGSATAGEEALTPAQALRGGLA